MPNHPFFSSQLDLILAEIALRNQLPPSKHRLADERYHTLCGWIDRKDSPLHGRVGVCYVQGSMAIGATIAARTSNEEYDIDAIAPLLLSVDADPKVVLDLLFNAIRGEKGSQYYDMAKRRTRCVTVYYADGMHLDITPAVRTPSPVDRTSLIFHSDPEKPHEPPQTLLMNAWGFCEWFKRRTLDTTGFAEAFSQRSRSYDTAFKAAAAEPVRPHEDPDAKSTDVISLMLMKRNRNLRYANRTVRMPPSVMMSRLVGNAAKPMTSIFEALRHHVKSMRDVFAAAERENRLLEVRNPECYQDNFTDRWPLNRINQQIYLADLNHFAAALDRLANRNLDIRDIQEILIDLFGDYPVRAAVRAAQEAVGEATRSGTSLHAAGGGLALASAVVAPKLYAAPRNTNFGGEYFE